jgi:putative membrane protein
VVVLTMRQAGDYRLHALAWAAVLALAVPAFFLVAANIGSLEALFGFAAHSWIGAPSLTLVYAVQVALFIALALLFSLRSVQPYLASRKTKRAQARETARAEFFVHGLHLTEHRTGVLIFVAFTEHYVEILADEGIVEKVAQSAWDAILQELAQRIRAGQTAQGLALAVERVGDILAAHVPPKPDDANELPNRVIEI